MNKRFLITIFSLICVLCLTFGLTACGDTNEKPNGSHTHTYQWMDNGDGTHKQHCSVSGCDAPDVNIGSHVWGADNKCEQCKAAKQSVTPAHTHNWSHSWEKDGTSHWHSCTAEGCTITDNSQKDGYAKHDFTDGDCVCGQLHTQIWAQSYDNDD